MATIRLPNDTRLEDLREFKAWIGDRKYRLFDFRRLLYGFLRMKRKQREKAARATCKALEGGLRRLIAEPRPQCGIKELLAPGMSMSSESD